MKIEKILNKYKYKVSNKSREFILKNVYLYPAFFMILQLPIFLQTHNVFLFISLSFSIICLIMGTIFHKKKLICHTESITLFFINTIVVGLSYLFFFLGGFDLFEYSFLLYSCISMIIGMDFFILMIGRQKENNKHEIMDGCINNLSSSEQKLLDYLITVEYILLKYLFTVNKTMHISYIPKLEIYFKVKQDVLDNKFQTYYVFSQDIAFVKEYLINDFSKYVEDFELDIYSLTYQDIQLFIMNKY